MSRTIRSELPDRPNAGYGTTPASAIANTSSGKAGKTSMDRAMTASAQPPKKPAMIPMITPRLTASAVAGDGDEQGDLCPVDDPAEHVTAEGQIGPQRVREADPAPGAVGAAEGRVDQVRVEGARVLHQARPDDRDQDEEDDI